MNPRTLLFLMLHLSTVWCSHLLRDGKANQLFKNNSATLYSVKMCFLFNAGYIANLGLSLDINFKHMPFDTCVLNYVQKVPPIFGRSENSFQSFTTVFYEKLFSVVQVSGKAILTPTIWWYIIITDNGEIQ